MLVEYVSIKILGTVVFLTRMYFHLKFRGYVALYFSQLGSFPSEWDSSMFPCYYCYIHMLFLVDGLCFFFPFHVLVVGCNPIVDFYWKQQNTKFKGGLQFHLLKPIGSTFVFCTQQRGDSSLYVDLECELKTAVVSTMGARSSKSSTPRNRFSDSNSPYNYYGAGRTVYQPNDFRLNSANENKSNTQSNGSPSQGRKSVEKQPEEWKQLKEPSLFPEIGSTGYGSSDDDFYDGIPRFPRALSQKSQSRRSRQTGLAKVGLPKKLISYFQSIMLLHCGLFEVSKIL